MEGEIGVTSKPAHGSTFWFTVRVGLSTSQPRQATVPPLFLKNIRILVVDNNPAHAEILSTYLSHWGAQVDIVSTGTVAFTTLMSAAENAKPYQIAFIDQIMPEVDGLTVGEQISQTALIQATRLIMLTAFDDKEQSTRARAAGFSAYLTKPLRQLDLRNHIIQVLEASAETMAIPATSSHDKIE
jgi:CheY-like chemotaxis protein